MESVRLDPPGLRPGTFVPSSGLYRACHDGHRPDHLVTAIKGDIFPFCRKCREAIRFVLWCESDYLLHDWDLTGPHARWLDSPIPAREAADLLVFPPARPRRRRAVSSL